MSRSASLKNVRTKWNHLKYRRKRICSFDDEESGSQDSDIQKIMHRTEKVLNDVMAEGVHKNEITLNILKDWITSVLEMQVEVANVILNNILDVCAHEAVWKLVKEHFDISEATLNIFQEFLKCIKNMKENQMKVKVAIMLLMPKDKQSTESERERALHDLYEFVTANNPFSEDFVKTFEAVLALLVGLQEKLRKEEQRLNRKLKHVKGWIKISSILFAVTCSAIFVCTVVAATIALPGFTFLLPAIQTFPFASLRKRFSSLWKKYEAKVQERRDVIHEANEKTLVAVKELEEIRRLINKLPCPVKFVGQFGCDVGDPSSLQVVLEKLSEQNALFCKNLGELEHQVNLSRVRIQNNKFELHERVAA